MNGRIWLKAATHTLDSTEIGSSRLDALVLLEDVTGRNRAWWLAHPEAEISDADIAKLEKLLKLRTEHLPLAYIRGKTEFYGRELFITPAVLQPRPESETMIDLLKSLIKVSTDDVSKQKYAKIRHVPIRIADLGAGSGALGITAALEVPQSRVDLIEVDAKAVEVAKMNVDKFTLGISVIESDLLAGTSTDYDILLCNLPYVPDDYQINRAALHEPHLAIFGGPDGLDIYRQLFQQIQKKPNRPLFILTESLPPQHSTLQLIAKEKGYFLQKTDDFIQLFERRNRP